MHFIKGLFKRYFESKGLKLLPKEYHTRDAPGHFYSPIPNKDEVIKDENRLFSVVKRPLSGIDLNEQGQLDLLEKLKVYYSKMPFSEREKEGYRFFFENDMFCYADAIILYSMMRHLNPKKIIEVGSGYSSGVMLDTIEYYLDGKCQCTFIDPDTERLENNLKEKDKTNHQIISQKVQDVPLEKFKELNEGDILFIDSSHVTRIGSDVNFLFFEVIPQLNPGVVIHIHDIFYPFEYPKKWILEGRAWNEQYLLRAFLQCNHDFKILLFNNFLGIHHKEWIEENMPLFLKNIGGSFWFQKVV